MYIIKILLIMCFSCCKKTVLRLQKFKAVRTIIILD